MNTSMNVILNHWSLGVQVAILLVFVVVFSALIRATQLRYVRTWWLAWCLNALALLAVLVVLIGTERLPNLWFRFIYLIYAAAKINFALLMAAALHEALLQQRPVWLTSLKQGLVMAGLAVLSIWAIGLDTLKIQIMVYCLVGLIFTMFGLRLSLHVGRRLALITVLVFVGEGLLFLHHGAVLLPTQWGGAVPDYMTHISFIDAVYECVLGIACLFLVVHLTQAELQDRNRLLSESQRTLRGLLEKDNLTGLWHKNYFETFMKQQKGASLAHIKIANYNDIVAEWGHPVGDLCLKWTAETMHEVFDQADGLFRTGQNAFMVVSPQAEQKAMDKKIKAMQKAVAMSTLCGPIYQLEITQSPYRASQDLPAV